MAFGFPAKFKSERGLVGSREAARHAIHHAFSVLGWSYNSEGPDRFRVPIGVNFSSWGETITITLDAGTIRVESACSMPMQLFDWGKNKQNVSQFLAHFVPAESRNQKLETTPEFLDETGNTPLERVLAEGEDHKI